ncbi:zinc transporter ZIP1-like [Ornithodoros turicata]|uniref:zinc transporter ZIP1-like n=1 Tax=Ornithodoros turicata TaxID=34597 RepID=UPI00313A1AD4
MVLSAQVIAPLLLLFGTFTLGTIPICLVRLLQRSSIGPRVLSFLICLGGGVLFATSFLHLLPEVREGFEELATTFPVAEGVVCFGFFAVYLVEELVHTCLKHTHHVMDHGHAHSPAVIACSETDQEMAGNRVHIHLPPHSASTKNDKQITHHLPPPPLANVDKGTATSPTEITTKEKPALSQVTLSGLLIVAALSFHSLFEGLSLGVQSTNKDTWIMFLAISLHKFVIAFVVGFDLSAGDVRRKVIFFYMGIFSIMSPLGALIGVVTSSNFEGLAVTALNGIASGTLIYVTFFEVLQRQRKSMISGLLQLLAVVLGFSVMLVMVIVLPSDHDHEGDTHSAHA